MSEPLVFLDIDGVLNTTTFYDRLDAAVPNSFAFLDPEAIARLNRLVEVTGASLVITSARRLTVHIMHFKEAFEAAGYRRHCNIIGMTPSCLREDASHGLRGREIQEWLDLERSGEEVPIAILDDVDDYPTLQHRFIPVDRSLGLQDEHVDRAILMLRGS